jgi:cell division inhibitor SepF
MAETNPLHWLWTKVVSLFREPSDEEDESPEVADPATGSVPGPARIIDPHGAEKTGPLHMLRSQRAEYAGMPVVLARPRNMEDATAVAERVKDRVPVIMNLEGVDESMARRLVDFIGGVIFALDGSLRKSGRAVYVCTPADIPLEELRVTPQQQQRRTSLFDQMYGDEPQQIAL